MVRPDLGLQSRREKGDPGGDSCSVGRASFAPLLHSRLPNRRRLRVDGVAIPFYLYAVQRWHQELLDRVPTN